MPFKTAVKVKRKDEFNVFKGEEYAVKESLSWKDYAGYFSNASPAIKKALKRMRAKNA